MEIEAIVQELNRRLAAPLPEFHKRHVIFWRDEDQEFLDQLFELQLILPAKFVQLKGNNNFEVKKLLEHDDVDSNYVVYDPLRYDKKEDDWLLNLRLLSEEFRSDLVTMWIHEMKLSSAPPIYETIKTNRKFFNAKDRRDKIVALHKQLDDPGKVCRAILAVLCGINSIASSDILKAVILGGIDQDKNEIFLKIQNYSMVNFFWERMAETGFHAENPNLHDFARYLILTATAQTLPKEHLLGLEDHYSPHKQYQGICYDILSEWLHKNEGKEQIHKIICQIENELHLRNRIAEIPINDLLRTESLPCIDDCILLQAFKEVKDKSLLPDELKAIVAKRRTMAWYNLNKSYYEGAWQCAEMLVFHQEHGHGFHTVDAKKLWQEYTDDYCRMDTFYRKYHLAFKKTIASPNPYLDDQFKGVTDFVEGIYSNWYLTNLGDCWAKACQDDLREKGKIADVPQQEDFYQSHIEHAENKVYVVISDGLRYEVAAQAAEELRRNTQSEVTLDSCQAIFPTVTKFGMAALLPHQELSITQGANGVSVLADGVSSESTNREHILQKKNPSSVALQFSQIRTMKRAERLNLVRGKEVIYIYTDSIDKAGHSSPSDVFDACEVAINDIADAVRMIVNDFCAHHIFITSDHGFLYTYHALQEEEKIDKGISSAQAVEVDSRYLITTPDAKPEHMLPIYFMHGKTDYSAFAPRENIRIKKQGGYTNYIHGGVSPQEMIVPVIYYHFLRNSNRGYREHPERYDTMPVSIQLVSSSRKISNMMFNLSFYQKEPVGDNRAAATYLLYFIDSEGQKISDEQKVIADKTDMNEQKRISRCVFNLKSMEYRSTDKYYLVIADASGVQPPRKEEFQINLVFASDSFGFFTE